MTIGERVRESNEALANEVVYHIEYMRVWVGLNGVIGLTHDEVVKHDDERRGK